MVDRYEIGERQTSACAAPTEWARAARPATPRSCRASARSSCTPRAPPPAGSLPSTFSDLRLSLAVALLRDGSPATTFETATVERIDTGPVHRVHTDRGELRAPLVVDALGWRRLLSNRARSSPRRLACRAGSRCIRRVGRGPRGLIDPRYVRAGYSWSFPAAGELRVGVGSFRAPAITSRRRPSRSPAISTCPAVGFQGNWIPHKLRPATEDGVFFVGDSAGHCLPADRRGHRPAFYFALALGRELRHGPGRAGDPASRRSSAMAASATSTPGSTAACSPPSTWSGARRRASRCAPRCAPSACRRSGAGPSGTTLRSRRRSSRAWGRAAVNTGVPAPLVGVASSIT